MGKPSYFLGVNRDGSEMIQPTELNARTHVQGKTRLIIVIFTAVFKLFDGLDEGKKKEFFNSITSSIFPIWEGK